MARTSAIVGVIALRLYAAVLTVIGLMLHPGRRAFALHALAGPDIERANMCCYSEREIRVWGRTAGNIISVDHSTVNAADECRSISR